MMRLPPNAARTPIPFEWSGPGSIYDRLKGMNPMSLGAPGFGGWGGGKPMQPMQPRPFDGGYRPPVMQPGQVQQFGQPGMQPGMDRFSMLQMLLRNRGAMQRFGQARQY